MRNMLIDLENVRSAGLEGVGSLDSEDTVYIFYSTNAFNLNIPTLESINNSKATTKYIMTNYYGANAMDFQIVSLFGALVERFKKGSFYIISHDHGFRSCISFCSSYFADYDIRVGVFDNIINALTAELKPASAANTNPAKDKGSEAGAKDTEAASDSRSSGRRRHSHGNRQRVQEVQEQKQARTQGQQDQAQGLKGQTQDRQQDQAQGLKGQTQDRQQDQVQGQQGRAQGQQKNRNGEQSKNKPQPQYGQAAGNAEHAGNAGAVNKASVKNNMADADLSETEEDEDMGMTGETNGNYAEASEKTGSSRRRRSRRRSKKNNSDNSSDASGNDCNKSEGNVSYVCDILKDTLSKDTLAYYAPYIDKAVRASSTKDELHNYFKKNHGDQEGEALFKVVQPDFDSLKASLSRNVK